MSYSEEFGRLLSEGLHSIAAHEGKPLLDSHGHGVKREIADELGLKPGSVDKWMRGQVPTDPERVVFLAEACVKRGRMDEQWLDRFLTSANFSDKDKRTLRQKLFPATKSSIRHNLPPR